MSAESLEAWGSAVLPLLWFLVVLAVLFLLWASGLLSGLVRRIKKVSGFGLDLEFSEEAAASNRSTIVGGLEELREALIQEIDHKARVARVFPKVKQLIKTTSESCELLDSSTHPFRVTIHIPDPLLENSLYQLIPYYPSGGKSGRSFSSRVGLIGRAWRTEESQPPEQATRVDQDELIREWGMTELEALASNAKGRTLYAAVILGEPGDPVAIMYFDWEEPTSIPEEFDGQGFINAIRSNANALGLIEVLRNLVSEIEAKTPRVDLHSL